jgi:hypothetical protein
MNQEKPGAPEQALTTLKRVLQMISKNAPATALNGGIPKDPGYKPQKPFFINGLAKNPPLTPILPPTRELEPERQTPLKALREALLNPSVKQRPVTGEIQTIDGKIAPEEMLDQYLENIEGGKTNLIEETQKNYQDKKDTLPWQINPENRARRIPVKVQKNHTGSFSPKTGEVAIGEELAKKGSATFFASTQPQNPKCPTKNDALSNGLPENGGTLTYEEVVGHELLHGATTSSTTRLDSLHEKLNSNVSPERPYFYGSSEEYKVGTLTFLNKSRQLTGKKLVEPQEIHQLFDEIERDPSILNKNYSVEEARLPRTYLLLKKTNPQGAELLRNAAARDCQYLAQTNQKRAHDCLHVANLAAPEKIDPSLLQTYSQIANPSLQNIKGIAQLRKIQEAPLLPIQTAGIPKKPNRTNPQGLEMS